jgi:hypothetical protein
MSLRQRLLRHAIDYAGLFPPASLGLDEAVAAYRAYRGSPDAWALGRFVVAAPRLESLLEALDRVPAADPPDPVPLALVAAPEDEADWLGVTGAGPRAQERGAVVEAVELRVASPRALAGGLPRVPAAWECFVEVPLNADTGAWIDALRGQRSGAKFRTGGVEPGAFPPAGVLLAALRAAVEARVPFKCTAGLHHPVRGSYPLTYAPDSPTGLMYGYLNVFLAAAALLAGWTEAGRILEEDDPGAFQVSDTVVAWRGRLFPPAVLDQVRVSAMRAFGSCSFREPVDELAALAAA